MKAGIVKRYRFEFTLALLVLLTFLFGLFPSLVESWYSNGIYPHIGRVMRFIFGWIPFSLGDVLYGLFFLYIVYKIFDVIRKWRRKKLNVFARKRMTRKFLKTIMIIYLAFQWLWGLNYHRLGSAHQLKFEPAKYETEELVRLADTLKSRLDKQIVLMQPADSLVWKNFDTVCKACVHTYKEASVQFKMFRYKIASVKTMILPQVGGFGGFSGYLNPFTGEAQSSKGLPSFLQPAIICHEMAHQLGYAAEAEANLVSYFVCKSSSNPAIRYSVYHDMMMYTTKELYRYDSAISKAVYDSLPELVRSHHLEAIAYYTQFKNPFQKAFNKWYDLYLKANSQARGVRSYNYVTAWLIGYARAYGWDKL